MYKDKAKQREANRKAQAKFKAKGITNKPPSGITNRGITTQNCNAIPGPTVIPCEIPNGDTDISVVKALHKVISKPKRGKDIKCFADLHPSIQQSIDRMSVVDGKIDQTVKAKRTAIAINYQHLFPDRYYGTGAVWSGVVTGKPGDAGYNGICTNEWRAERGR